MKKKRAVRTRRVSSRKAPRTHEHYLVVVRSWMLVVIFALMLGVGAVVGTFVNQRLDQAFRAGYEAGDVAGAQVELPR